MRRSGERLSPTFRGAIWSYAGSLYLTGGQFVLGVVLARLLRPAEFGLFIAVTAYTSLLLLVAQFGLPQAVLQARSLSRDALNAAFFLLTGFALVCFGCAWIAVIPLAAVYRAPGFATVFLCMAGTLLLTPYTSLGLAVLRREMRFDEVARLDISAFSMSAASAVLAALVGAGAYSLVLAAFVSMAIKAAGIAGRLKWRPQWPRFEDGWTLLKYARFAAINSLISVSGNRVDNMMVGGLLGTAALGLYNRAYSLARIPPDQFGESIGPLLLGSFSRIQNDAAASRTRFFEAVGGVTLLTWPFLVALLVVGPQVIALLYGEAWRGAGLPLQAMIGGAACLVVVSTLRGLINAQGLVAELVGVNLWTLGATVVVVIGLSPYGLTAVAVGISLREAFMCTLMLRLARRSRLGIAAGDVLYAVLPALIGSSAALLAGLIAASVAHRAEPASTVLAVLAGSGAVFVSYAAVVGLLMLLWKTHVPLVGVRDRLLGLVVR
ncbi:MAG: oligosaccharide flippase family protein [Thiohalocapsa sp.]|nr:oligosaccharide flippase family protein [Thiohalocapsa sp.]MCG6942559.1 oligosaccharide flippase family protein [Thiohalocapsa sp.]